MKATIPYLISVLLLFLISGNLQAQLNEYYIPINFVGGGSCGFSSCPNPTSGETYELITSTGLQTYSFMDPLIPGDVAQSVTVEYFGDCVATMQISLNGHILGTESIASSCECACEPGGQFRVSSVQFPSGIPGYVIGGTNNLNIDFLTIGPNAIVRNYYANVILNDPTLSQDGPEGSGLAIKIVPNPASDYFTISNLNDNGTLEMFDALGKKVREMHIVANTATRINTNQFNKGLYFVKIIANNKTTTKKIIVQ